MNKWDLIKWSPRLTKLAYNVLYAKIAQKQQKLYAHHTIRLQDLKNIHKGKRCFIVGTGPSLTINDLELLKNEITFAPNRIYELLNNTSWRPTYYLCQDHNIIKQFGDKIKSIDAELLFLPVEYVDEFLGDKFRFFVLRENEFYPDNADFSFCIDKYIAQGYTVTYGAIQLAFYMGFSEIYLVGVDHNYKIIRDASGRPTRSSANNNYSSGMTDYVNMNNLPRIEESTIAYETANKIAGKLGVKIYNATRGGCLEAFERVNLDNIVLQN